MVQQLFYKGHTACAGCGMTIALRHILDAAGPNTIVSNATSCSEIVSSQFPITSWGVPYIHVAFETAAAVASGIEVALKSAGKEANVIAIAGDGGTIDIGLQALSGMVDRRHNVLYVCYDNECYANTGIQRSGATPYGAWTTTSPNGKVSIGNKTFKKPICEMMIAQGAVYVATASSAYPDDLKNKIKKALSIKGPKFILVHAPCPTAWKCDSSKSIEIARLAVDSGMFVVYEMENNRMTINVKPKFVPVEQYLRSQGRFKHLTGEEIARIQIRVNYDWKRLGKRYKRRFEKMGWFPKLPEVHLRGRVKKEKEQKEKIKFKDRFGKMHLRKRNKTNV
ncbi:MAG: hypothetical protein HZB67_03535 [Candidatus Aenigmarchaeota archaeon]|nr:hypothetical protein [Candidatus Aenigmarchaeota archaeon]